MSASGSREAVQAAHLLAFEIKHDSELTSEERARVEDWLHQAWPPATDPYVWRRLDWHVLARMDDELVSHVEVGSGAITVGGCPIQVAALGSVYTPDERRGSGLATATMLRAQELICGELGVRFALLLCEPELIPFYARIGWTVAAGPLIFDQPPDRLAALTGLQRGSSALSAPDRRGTVIWPDAVMVYSCSDEPWPPGLIDLCGLPW